MENSPAVGSYVTVGNAELVYEVLGLQEAPHRTIVWVVSGADYYRSVDVTFLKPVAANAAEL